MQIAYFGIFKNQIIANYFAFDKKKNNFSQKERGGETDAK